MKRVVAHRRDHFPGVRGYRHRLAVRPLETAGFDGRQRSEHGPARASAGVLGADGQAVRGRRIPGSESRWSSGGSRFRLTAAADHPATEGSGEDIPAAHDVDQRLFVFMGRLLKMLEN